LISLIRTSQRNISQVVYIHTLFGKDFGFVYSSMLRVYNKWKKRRDSSVFGQIDDVAAKYNTSRDGEIHTKVIDVPSPMEGSLKVDDILEPSRYIFLEFEGIHNGHYIGINDIKIYDDQGTEISYTNTQVDGKNVDNDTVKPAFPVNGWWAVCGEQHSLLFEFEQVTHVSEIHISCANSSATPKLCYISDSTKRAPSESELAFSTDCYIQLAGAECMEPTEIKFCKTPASKDDSVTCSDIIDMLNQTPPKNGFKSYISYDGTSSYAFFCRGLRRRAYTYYFGDNATKIVAHANSICKASYTKVDDVAKRAMTLEELQVVRAIILSRCVSEGWKSSRDGSIILPDDVNLYDLNSCLIMPSTKKRNCAFKELFPSGESAPIYYSSHWWGEKILDFIRCCEVHAKMNKLEPHVATYWVCAYANRQHDLGTDLGTDPDQSSFRRAMTLSQGVLLILDPDAVVFSRIWVDFELFKTVNSGARNLDIVTRYAGKVHLLADHALPGEVPYQKVKREAAFPFKTLGKAGLGVELYKGEASMEIDKVRILNSMTQNTNLDDTDILVRANNGDVSNSNFAKDLTYYNVADSSLKSAIALKCWAFALHDEGLIVDLDQAPLEDGGRHSSINFHGHNLATIVKNDTNRTSIIMNDFVSCDMMDNNEFDRIIGTVSSHITHFELDVSGCKNLTNECLSMIEHRLPKSLITLKLNFGYSAQITDEGLVELAKQLPKALTTLHLTVTPNKLPSGSWEPVRLNEHLMALAKHLPTTLVDFTLTTTLGVDETDEGIVELAKNLPIGIKKFKLHLNSWPGFKGIHFVELAKYLPQSLETLDLYNWGGVYLEEGDIKMLRDEVLKLENLKEFQVETFDDGTGGYYAHRKLSLDELKSFS